MLKILHVLSNPWMGGTETFLLNIVPRMRRCGTDTRVVNLVAGGGMVGPAMVDAGIPYSVIEQKKLGVSWTSALALRRVMHEHRYDAVCAYGLRATLMLRMAGRPHRNAVTATGLRSMDTWRRWYHVWLDRLTERRIDCFVGNSEAVCAMRRRRERTPADKVVCIPNGIDCRQYAADAEDWPDRAALGLPPGFICLTVANLRSQKGYPFYLDAIHAMEGLDPSVRFVWVGRPDEGDMLRGKAERLGLGERVIFYGHCDDPRPLMAHADAFVLSSREEGMPRAMMEAMAMGTPCLATDVGGNAEVLRHGQDGLIVPYGDVNAFAQALRTLIEDAGLRQEFSRSAAQRIRETYDIERIAEQYVDLFARLVAQRRRGS